MLKQQTRTVNPGDRVVGLLDVGSSKVTCLIASVDGHASARHALSGVRIIGLGHRRSQGVKAGVITDLDAAETSVRACVSQAERMAGVTLEDVYVSVSCGRLRSKLFRAHADTLNGVVGESDISRLIAAGRAYAERDGRSLVHINRTGIFLDGVASGLDPRGLSARRLTGSLHAVTADEGPLRNLILLVERCFLNVRGLVAAPYASAIAATTEDERRLGVMAVDIGGGVTTLSVFSDGNFVGADAIPVGANHITYDIARMLQTPLAEAERIKALYGTLVFAQSDQHEVFDYPLQGEDAGSFYQATKAELSRIIEARIVSLINLVKERIKRSGFDVFATDSIVLTGGGSQLVGVGPFAANAFGVRARAGGPQNSVSGLPENMVGPAFSTVVGMLIASVEPGDALVTYEDRDVLSQGYLARVGQWLMDDM